MRISTWNSLEWGRFTLVGIIGSAYLLRVLMMPITGQHDILFMPWMSQNLSLGSPNIYANLHRIYGDVILQQPAVWAPYPYGFYALTAGWSNAVEFISGHDFSAWSTTWGVEKPARLVFFFKLIYLPFDLLILFLLYTKVGRLAGVLWAWSPVAIYTPFMMGQNDIYATACSIAAIWAVSRYNAQTDEAQPDENRGGFANKPAIHWPLISVLLLGIGAAFKIFPLLLLPPLLLNMPVSWKHRFGLGLAGIAPFLAVIAPFLTTPAFIDGVLFNPEGSQLFRQVEVLGYPLPLFVIGYALLLIGLVVLAPLQRTSTTQPKVTTPKAPPWAISMLVFALLFLLIPTPSYWLIWLTPILAAGATYSRLMLWGWIMVQMAFALTLPSLHRELGVALPVHFDQGFNIPNLPESLQITQSSLTTVYDIVLSISTSMMMGGLLLVIGGVVYQTWIRPNVRWAGPHRQTAAEGNELSRGNRLKQGIIVAGILLPTLCLFLGLGVNLYAGRHLVSQNRWQPWQPYEISADRPLIQEIANPASGIYGGKVKIVDTQNQGDKSQEKRDQETLQLCFFEDGIENQAVSSGCASAAIGQQREDGNLYLFLEQPIRTDSQVLSIRLQPEQQGSAVFVEVAENKNFGTIVLDGSTTTGLSNLSTLSAFEPSQAFNNLVVENILSDRQLLIWLLCVIVGVSLFIFVLI